MRNAENNEVDLLLRDLARREGAEPAYSSRVGAEEKDGPGGHLDADELSSFAEGVLPANTRSLYATHLADCSRCRKIVAQLALSSGAAVRQVAVEPSKSKLWSYIARLFTPAVMRYAIPALSLVILAAFGVIWLQQSRRSDFVARNNESVVASEPGLSGAPQPALTQEQTNQVSAARSAAAPNPTPQAGSDSFRKEEKAQAKNKTVATRSSEKAQKVAEPSELNDSVAALPSGAPTIDANAPPPPKPAGGFAENKREEAAPARQPRSAANASVQSEDERRNRSDRDAAVAKEKDDKKSTTGSVAGRRAMVTTGATQSADESTTTRTVAGRHFRRVNNAWVDTAYDSGAQVTTLARGSEQYRALIGDEPGLRSIAEQLTGEVIVVWKGRTYRIR